MLLNLNDGDLIGIEVNSSIVNEGCPTCGWGSEQYTALLLKFDNGKVFTIERESAIPTNVVGVIISFEDIVRAFSKITDGYTWFNGTCEEFSELMKEEILNNIIVDR